MASFPSRLAHWVSSIYSLELPRGFVPLGFGAYPHCMDRASTQHDPAQIREAQNRFIETWGRMGSAWGVSRTLAEVHALLYITGDALCTDDVMDRLEISRGNASMTLRGLTDWGIVRRVHKRGDRKEYFQAEADVWNMFKTIATERKKRELDPVVTSLYEIRDLTGMRTGAAPELVQHNERLDRMLEAIEALNQFSTALFELNADHMRATFDQLPSARAED